jgi:simple sugar transport system permease protein
VTPVAGGDPPTREPREPTISLPRRFFSRPEAAAAVGFIVVYMIFAMLAGGSGFLSSLGVANVMNVAAQFGIIGATVTLLLIAGDFDLSVGSVVGFCSVFYATGMTLGWPPWLAIVATLAIALGIGAVNGFLVIKTGMPSFIVTLAALFTIRGAAIGWAYFSSELPGRIPGSTFIGGLDTGGDPVAGLFGSAIVGNFHISIVWWLVMTLIAWYVLTRTVFGNWIFATGGSVLGARQLGVPVARVKMILFTVTALSAGILAVVQVSELGGADGLRGGGKEFEAAITAVIGGTLLFGGYGSPLGTILGALTLATVQMGLFFVGIDPSLYQFVLGFLLLTAVFINNITLKRALGTQR